MFTRIVFAFYFFTLNFSLNAMRVWVLTKWRNGGKISLLNIKVVYFY